MEWYHAAQEYLARLGAAEYEAQSRQHAKAGKAKSTFKYSPTGYHRDLVELLGKGDEEGFKARKALEGYSSALGV